MRIFYASDNTPNSDLRSDLWRNNLYLPLIDLGHDVVEFDYEWGATFTKLNTNAPEFKSFIAENRPRVSAELLSQLKTAHQKKPIDLFFSYFYDACVLPEAIDEIRAMGIVTVNWYCNGSYQLQLVSEISPHYDWCLVPEKFRMKDYEAMGAHPIYCQEAANDHIYKPYDLPVEFDVTFVGQCYGERPGYIKFLQNAQIDVKVWGLGWRSQSQAKRPSLFGSKLISVTEWKAAARRVLKAVRPSQAHSSLRGLSNGSLPPEMLGGPLSDLELIQMFSRSKINLGFSTCGNTHESSHRILQVRLRDFEVPMSGGFYMVEYMEELEEFYEIGKEIVCYRDPDDLVDKIRYYLSHDAEREQIRQAGHSRCLLDHTWQKRFTSAFRQMGIE